MKLEERYEDDFSFIEDKDKATDKPRMRILATVQEADRINKNNRMYPRAVLSSAAAAFQWKLKHRAAFGEVDHPAGKAKLRDTSHLITQLFWDKKNDRKLCAEMLVLNTQAGETLKEIVRAGGKPGLSSRGRGVGKKERLNGKEAEVIQPGFRFDSFDFVIDPSVKSAKIKRIFESANGEDIELLERVHKKLQSTAGIKREDVKREKDPSRLHRKLQAMAGIRK